MRLISNAPRSLLKVLLPVVVIAACLAFATVITGLRPEQEKKEPVPNYPKVELYDVRSEPVVLAIGAQGTVQPRQQTRLTARVSGHIESVSANFYEGGSFKTGDILLRLDPLPYESAVAEARSRLALAEATLLQEQEAAEQARIDWAAVGSGEPNPLVLRIPQLEKAQADLEASRVSLQMARENLSYTEIKAPYTGRVQAKHVDVGQAITAQATILGEIFSTDAMEVPLSISLDDLAYIGPIDEAVDTSDRPKVYLRREIAGVPHTWEAFLDRTAASVDQRTRMITAYARMNPPFVSNQGASLTPGMFVSATIEGEEVASAKRIPRAALQPG
ncbi:MAG: efflux RND transporter periplasmic adaptor subunit, partial [Puniceicoccaceae bacterium]